MKTPIDEERANKMVQDEMRQVRREWRLNFLLGVAVGVILTLLVLGLLGRI